MRRIARHLGLVIGVLGLAFVIHELVRSWDDVTDAAAGADPTTLLAAGALGGLGMVIIGLGWGRTLAVLGVSRPPLDTLYRYFVGELGKYVPGGIWAVLGRSEMAQRGGVPRQVAYGSTMLALAVTYLAAVLTSALALAAGAAASGAGVAFLLIGLVVVGVLALHPRVMETVLRLVGRIMRRDLEIPVPPWRASVGLLLWHVPAWLAIGGATWLVAVSLDPTAPDLRNLLFATTLSWAAGFVAVPVPGGIGVREAVLVATATSLGSAGVAAAVAIIARVVFVLIDVSAAGLFALIARRDAAPPSRSPPVS
jgi:uncharacterized membrane protein YbhN (UPF0104 family)